MSSPEADLSSTEADAPRIELLVPDQLAIDPDAARRLADRLGASPPEVVAVAAPLRAVPAGSSARTQAEWAAVEAAGQLRPSRARTVTGAVAVRGDANPEVGTRTVTLAHGSVLIDEGASCYDPNDPAAAELPAEPAGAQGRPPFRWRPVVLWLAAGESAVAPEALRDLVNGLVANDVEARLAVGRALPGPHVTRPCTPTIESWRALRPDLVVLVDEGAAALATDWGLDRGTVFVALDADRGDGIELVSWTIGQTQGRVRARIGPRVAPAALARLVNRLCSGPQPGPPTDAPAELDAEQPAELDEAAQAATVEQADERTDERASSAPVASPRRRRGAGRPAVRVALVDSGAGPVRTRADQLERNGHRVQRVPGDLAAPDLAQVDLLVLDDQVDPAALARWRAQAGPGARVVLEVTDPTPEAAEARLALARLAGQVVVDDPAAATGWRRLGVRALVSPAQLDPDRIDALTAAGDRRRAAAAPLLGWWRGTGPTEPSAAGSSNPLVDAEAAIRAALADFVARQPEAQVEVLDPPGRDPDPDLDLDPHLIVRSGPPDPGWLAAWTAQIWSPTAAPIGSPIVLEAAFAGVPTLTTVLIEGTDPELLVEPPTSVSAWATALEALTDDRARARWSARARARAEALRGTEAVAMAVDRFLGWALAQEHP